MPVKPNGSNWIVKEQIVKDLASGLTFQFEVVPESTARYRLRIYGDDVPFGNREIIFDVHGEEAGSGVALTGLCQATWLREVT